MKYHIRLEPSGIDAQFIRLPNDTQLYREGVWVTHSLTDSGQVAVYEVSFWAENQAEARTIGSEHIQGLKSGIYPVSHKYGLTRKTFIIKQDKEGRLVSTLVCEETLDKENTMKHDHLFRQVEEYTILDGSFRCRGRDIPEGSGLRVQITEVGNKEVVVTMGEGSEKMCIDQYCARDLADFFYKLACVIGQDA